MKFLHTHKQSGEGTDPVWGTAMKDQANLSQTYQNPAWPLVVPSSSRKVVHLLPPFVTVVFT